jgi:DNA invertase Pin-like site-specific DNA recombinase
MIFGYARVSSDGQSLASQVSLLEAAGCQYVFREKVSGCSRTNRTELAKALRKLSDGDVLLVCRLDRLARSSRDLLNILHEVSEKGAAFRSVGDAWCDTTCAHGRLLLTVLVGLAQFEMELIKARTSEGRERAKKDGVRFGRPNKMTAHQVREALARRENGETLKAIARSYNVSAPTIFRLRADETALKAKAS